MISEAYSDFFKGLETNNHKEWFDAHRDIYEKSVRAPFLELIEMLLPRLIKYDAQIPQNPKLALFRINRDIRFSADKTPYNTLMKAGFSADGKKSLLPGFYLGISADTIHVGGGLFMAKAQHVKAIRDLILEQTQDFTSIVHGATFKKAFGGLKGEVAKRINKDHQVALPECPEIAHKQFYAMRELPLSDWLNKKGLEDEVMKYFAEANTLNRFLKQVF